MVSRFRRTRAPIHCQYRTAWPGREYRLHPICAGIAPDGAALRIPYPDDDEQIRGRFIPIRSALMRKKFKPGTIASRLCREPPSTEGICGTRCQITKKRSPPSRRCTRKWRNMPSQLSVLSASGDRCLITARMAILVKPGHCETKHLRTTLPPCAEHH